MTTPFGSDPVDRYIPESTVLHLSRLRHVDRASFQSALMVARADAARAKVAADADAASRERMAHRDVTRTAPTMSPDDSTAILAVMKARRCSGIEAAVIVGQEREAAKAER